MISHLHKCIFIHIPKVAGISIEQVFIDDLSLNFENRMALLLGKSTNKSIGPKIISHLTAKEYTKHKFVSKEIYDSYFKFSFVRNPYKRLYSTYKYLCYNYLISFDLFVKLILPKLIIDPEEKYFLLPMHKYIYDNRGKTTVDFIGKLENIDNDFQQVQSIIRLNDHKLKKLNESKEIILKTIIRRTSRIIKKYPFILLYMKPYKKSNHLSKEAKRIIINYYKKDFLLFKYKM